jgi:hypothetical protein
MDTEDTRGAIVKIIHKEIANGDKRKVSSNEKKSRKTIWAIPNPRDQSPH